MNLFGHQRRAVDIVLQRKKMDLWMETGTGKTATVLTVINESIDRRDGPVLVLCPLSIIGPAWCQDASTFTPELNLFPIGGQPVKHRLQGLEDARESRDIVVANYETLRFTPEILEKDFSMVVFDESTRLKDPSTSTSKMCLKLARRVSWIVAMSGCPAPNHEMEFYPQVKVVDRDIFPSSFTGFRHKYFYQPRPQQLQWLWQMRGDRESEFYEKIQSVSYMVRKDECLDLPEQTFETLEVNLGQEERRQYDRFLRDLVLRFEEGDVVGSNARSELMKLRQMTAGIAKTSEGSWVEIGKSKLKVLLELVESVTRKPNGSRKPVIVVGQFRLELERITSALKATGYTVGLIYGGVPVADRSELVTAFQAGQLDVLVGHPRAMGHGLTLTRASDMIWSSLTYSYEDYFQTMQRIHRIGQKNICTYYTIQGRDTVDGDIARCLDHKRSLDNTIVEEVLLRQGAPCKSA